VRVQAQIKLGRVMGVPVGLHYSWFLIAALITMSLGVHFGRVNPNWGAMLSWTLAVSTALLFFASLLVHELSHAAVARARGVPVQGITLFALGGVARIEQDAGDARTEFWMAIVGPVTSAVIGLALLSAAYALGGDLTEPAEPAPAVLSWLGYINLVVALFNMVPGFPLDGGRILRAAVWWKTGDRLQATRVAALGGLLVATGLIVYGLWTAFTAPRLGGLWLALVGWFLLEAARASYAQVAASELLRGLRVRDLMTADGGGVAATARAPRAPAQTQTVRPDAAASDALELMFRAGVNEVPVVEDGRLCGSVSRTHVLQVLRSRAEALS
jgi:Zn-dependent protease